MRNLLLAAVCVCLATLVPLSAEVTTNIKVPTTLTVFVPCAASGMGEMVSLSGDLHVTIAVTIDANGGLHMKQHFQPQGIVGYGSVTGAKYQATGVTQDQIHRASPGFPYEETFINRFHIVGQGPGNDFYVQDTVHITVNADGTATATVDNHTVTCK